MATLHCVDVFQHEESRLWYIEHNFNNGRKLKNRNAIRTIPLHPILADDFRFPQYVESVQNNGHRRVFPELTVAALTGTPSTLAIAPRLGSLDR